MAWLRLTPVLLLLLVLPHPVQARRAGRPRNRVVVGADHAGMALKGQLVRSLRRWGWQPVDAKAAPLGRAP
jgi:hypothetical protein